MDNNVVKTVLETVTTGCSNTVGGDCHWRREYLLLKERFYDYRREFSKVERTESKLEEYKEKVSSLKGKVDNEREQLRVKLNEVEGKELEIFQRGIDQGWDEAKDSIQFNKNFRSSAEADFMSAQGKIMLMEKEKDLIISSFERKISELEKENTELQKRNEILVNDLETIKTEADITVDRYRILKRKAVGDYVKLREQYTELKVAYINSVEKIEKEDAKANRALNECKKLFHENIELKRKDAERQFQYENDAQIARLHAGVRQSEAQKVFEKQLEWVTSQFTGLSLDFNNKIKMIGDVLNHNKYKEKKLNGTAAELKRTMTAILDEVYLTLVQLSKSQDAAVAKKESVENEMEIFAQNINKINKSIYEYIQTTGTLFEELMKVIGVQFEFPNGSEVMEFFKLQVITGNAEDEGFGDLPKFLFQLRREEMTLKKLVEGLKMWSDALKAQAERINERKSALEKQLEKEKLERYNEKEIFTAKLRIYKTLNVKLRGRLETVLRSLDSKFIPGTRFFKDHIEKDKLSSLHQSTFTPLHNYEEFCVMLEQAEEAVKKIEARSC